MKRLLVVSILFIASSVAFAKAEQQIYNWRSLENVEQSNENSAHMKNMKYDVKSFPDQPNEIWNWYMQENKDHKNKVKSAPNYNDPLYNL